MQNVDWMNDEDERPEWTITDDGAADWALRQVKDADDEYQRLAAHFQRQTASAAAKRDRTRQYFSAKLLDYFATLPVRKTKTQDAYDLPSGKLVLKRQQPKIEQDKPTLGAWMHENGLPTRTEYVPQWNELKPLTHIEGESVVLTETGEIIPGIKAIERPDEFRMETGL